MKRQQILTVVLLAILAIGLGVFAQTPQQPQQAQPTRSPEGLKDANGNPIPREAATPMTLPGTKRMLGQSEATWLQRGQGWWPYPESLPPYTIQPLRAETMNEDEIDVNGVADLSALDPSAALKLMPKDLLLAPGSQLKRANGYYLVKIQGFTRTQKEVSALQAAGAVLGEYLNINTYVARIPSSAYNQVKALPFVSAILDYQPAFKISPRIGLELIPPDEVYDLAGNEKPWILEVQLQKGADIQNVLNDLGLLSIHPAPSDVVSNEDLTTILVRTDPRGIPEIAKIPGVKWIAEKTYPKLMASSSSPNVIPMVLQNNGVFTTTKTTGWKLWNAGLDGSKSGTAQIITMMDTGLNTNMEHFSQDTVSVGTVGATHRKVVGYDVYGGDQCVLSYTGVDEGHGTWTSQHAVGSISNMSSNPDTTHTPAENYDDGIARGAKVYFQDAGTSTGALNPPADLGPSITAAIGKGSYIQNHSWGTSSNTYDTEASNLDTAIYNNPNMVVTVSAGNSGTAGQSTIGSPSTAKNCICVGGNDVANPDYLFEDCNWDGTSTCGGTNDLGSSRGPVATSNRIKPDICTYVAFSASVGGEMEAGDRPHAMCQTDSTKTVYWDWSNSNGFGGTSFASPEAAGLAAIVRDYFLSGYYPTGTATPANALTPSGSLVKALILASGEDMATTASPSTSITIAKRYSNDVGYGRANLPAVLHIGSGSPFLWIQNNQALGDGATNTSYYTINGNDLPLRIMMTYYDAAGNALQKDCDLKVTVGSTVYWGNNFSGGWSTSSTTTRDHTNNTEGFFLDSAHGLPASGTVRVDVIGYNDPSGMNYSLVVSGNTASQAVTQVSFDQGKYNCNQTVTLTVNDTGASSPVSVTLASKNSGGTTIDTQTVTCTGAGGVFTGTIQTGSGIAVADGGTLLATYNTTYTATANISCQLAVADGGYLIEGGCDNNPADPSDNSWQNEYYNKYMDAGEYNSYTFGFQNLTGRALTDATVTLTFSGAGASKMSVYNSPVHVGAVPVDGLTGAVFQVYTDPTTLGLTDVNMNFAVTSPADGFTAPVTLTQVQHLQTNDTIARETTCNTFTGSISPYYESVYTGVSGAVANPWQYVGNNTVKGENRTDSGTLPACGNSSNGVAIAGASGTATNFAANAFSAIINKVQPALMGNAPNGQPYYYAWKWHSFYSASEAPGNQTGVWGAFYNDAWNSSTNPTADNVIDDFPLSLAWYYQTTLDYGTTAWNWETANTGVPDDQGGNAPPNQQIITFPYGTSGLATSNSWFAWGQGHADLYWFTGTATTGRRDVAIDDDRLVYDEYYASAQSGASCGAGGQVGQVAFDRYEYNDCPASTAVLSVTDANATSPITVTVTSPGTGDSEVVTLTGAAPYFSGNLTLATNTGRGNNNGVLFVLPSEAIQATYTDSNPAGSTTAYATIGCTGGSVVYLSSAQTSDNGDNDGYADNNETVHMNITIQNNMATALTNAQVAIFTDSPNIDCITKNSASYGTVAGSGGTATNSGADDFVFHVAPSVQCTNWQAPPTATFTVVITGDNFSGSSVLQTFQINLDLDPVSGSSYTYTQSFDTDPGWAMGVTADDDGTCTSTSYTNTFHWCAACGNGNGGYGAWNGNSAFGTSGQEYNNYDSSTLYSPVFTANGNVTMSFSVAYRTEATYDGCIVQYKVANGSWTTLGFSTPAQSATTTSDYCSPLLMGVTAWNGTGASWTTTNAPTVTAASGQSIQFRWRLGSDSVNGGTTYGGYGVDNVTITNLMQTVACEATRNTGLPGCPAVCTPPSAPVVNSVTDVDACAQNGVQVNYTSGAPATRHDLYKDGALVVSSYSSGATYTPGDTSSHSYVVQAVNGSDTCYTDSNSMNGTDANNSVATPSAPGVADVDPCVLSGVSITWGSVSGATGYDLQVDGGAITADVTSPYTYSPGDSNSHTYAVRAKNATCTSAFSSTTSGTDAICSVPPEAAPGDSLSTAQTWTDKNNQAWPAASGIVNGYRLYRGQKADLASLLNTNTDSCKRYDGAATTANTPDDPTTLSAGDFYWYIVTAYNGAGEGSAGNATAGPRTLNPTGDCP